MSAAWRCCSAVAAIAGIGTSALAADDAPFAIQTISLAERVVQADLTDVDGDGRGDLLCIGLSGLPPDEQRRVHVFYQREDGVLPDRPDWSGALPPGAAAYDLADLDAEPGMELLLLRRDRLTLLSWSGRRPARRDLATPEPTFAVVTDERGLDRFTLVRRGLADAPRLVVPGLGWTAVLKTSGESLGTLDVDARAAYYLPARPAPVFTGSEGEIFLDHPRLLIGDVDGDGRGDVVSASRHELRAFLQDADGRFPSRPSRRIALGRVSKNDQVRGSGSVRIDGADFDRDGRLDLLVSASSGTVFRGTTRTTVHLNRGGSWRLDAPDQEFQHDSGLHAAMLLDLDDDGGVELIDLHIPTSALEIAELIVTREIDAEISVRRLVDGARFETDPWQRWKLGVGWSFDTFRTLGFVPTVLADVDGDGTRDLLSSGDGDELEIRLGDREKGYATRHATQELDTGGRIRFGQLDADGPTDFVLYDPRRPEVPLRIGRNRDVLLGDGVAPRPAVIGPRPEDD